MAFPAIPFLDLISNHSLNDHLCARQPAAFFND
jgi:hypothetical protein